MARAKHRYNERFAALPLSVMLSTAFRTMRPAHQRVVWILAALYDGRNNGDLALTRGTAKHFGMTTERDRCSGLAEAEKRGLIVRTSVNAGLSYGVTKTPTTWALTWRTLNVFEGEKIDGGRRASNAWQNYVPDTHSETSPDTHSECGQPDSPTLKTAEKPRSPTLTVRAPLKNLGMGSALGKAKS